MRFHVDVLDTWNMTITPVDEPFTIRQPAENGLRRDRTKVSSSIDVPDKPWMALRITRVEKSRLNVAIELDLRVRSHA